MPYNLLKQNINNLVEMSVEDMELFTSYFKPRIFKKKDFLLRQCNVSKFEGFVVEGFFKVFTIDEKGNENTLYFAASDWWLMDIDSFMNQKFSNLNIQALEDSQVLLINRTDKLELYEPIPILEKLFRIMSQKALIAW